MLRATQYLPDIVWLQQCLYDAFHHRLDKKDAMTQTIGEFLEKLASGNHNNLHTLLNSSISYYPYFFKKMLEMSTERELEVYKKHGH